MYMMSVDPEDAPDQPEYIEIGIVSGLPVSLNGKELSPASLLSELNEIGGRHAIGRVDMVENRPVAYTGKISRRLRVLKFMIRRTLLDSYGLPTKVRAMLENQD